MTKLWEKVVEIGEGNLELTQELKSELTALLDETSINYQHLDGKNTVLHKAVMLGHEGLVLFLCNQGPDFSIKNEIGDTALALAVSQTGRMADIIAKAQADQTLLEVAAQNGDAGLATHILTEQMKEAEEAELQVGNKSKTVG